MALPVAPVLWTLDQLRGLSQRRRRLKVLVHTAVMVGADGQPTSPPCYFIKATNLSGEREVEITHIWFDSDPPLHVLNEHRPLPARLKLDETFETWVPVASVPGAGPGTAERLVRVKLSSGSVVKGRPNKTVPPVGHVAGGGTRAG